jgi:hypothetical protein
MKIWMRGEVAAAVASAAYQAWWTSWTYLLR